MSKANNHSTNRRRFLRLTGITAAATALLAARAVSAIPVDGSQSARAAPSRGRMGRRRYDCQRATRHPCRALPGPTEQRPDLVAGRTLLRMGVNRSFIGVPLTSA
jgi:hypothetical protein